MRGYQLVEALRNEAEDTATEHRAALMRDAAKEIERLIQEVRQLADAAEAEKEAA